MPKKTVKKIRLDAPNEQVLMVKERIAALETNMKKVDDTFVKPVELPSRKP